MDEGFLLELVLHAPGRGRERGPLLDGVDLLVPDVARLKSIDQVEDGVGVDADPALLRQQACVADLGDDLGRFPSRLLPVIDDDEISIFLEVQKPFGDVLAPL